MSELIKLLDAAKKRAIAGGLPTRRKDKALYGLLAGCMFICEKVERENLHDELRTHIRISVDIRGENNAGKGRRYAEKMADVTVLVCRYVLQNDNRNSMYRYAATLREAFKHQIPSTELVEWLTKNGGVNALYKSRPVTARSVKLKVLNLTTAIEVSKVEPFTITLKYNGKGGFDVVNCVAT